MSPKQTSRTPGFYPATIPESTCARSVPVPLVCARFPARSRARTSSRAAMFVRPASLGGHETRPAPGCYNSAHDHGRVRHPWARSSHSRRSYACDGGALLLLQQQLDALRAQLGEALAGQGQLVGQQLALLTGQMNDRLREGLELVQRSQSAVGERLDNTSRVVGEVQKGLGELREATAKVYEVGRDVASLHDILRAPKLRGGLGELRLGDLLG